MAILRVALKVAIAHVLIIVTHSRTFPLQEDRKLSFESLYEHGTNVRTCRNIGNVFPFSVGDYITTKSVSRITVFDAEILRGMKDIKNLERINSTDGQSFLSLLAFTESDGSIKYSQWNLWGPGALSDAMKTLKLTCKYFPGLDASERAGVPLWEAEAVLRDAYYFANIFCPLPPVDHRLSNKILNADNFQLLLTLRDGTVDEILHLDPIPICRDNGIRYENRDKDGMKILTEESQNESPELIPLHKTPITYPQTPTTSVDMKERPTESNISVSICIRAFHDHNLFESKRSTHTSDRLIEYIDYHLLIGVNRIYFYDRYGTEMLPVLLPYIKRGLVVHIPFPEWSEVYYRKSWFHGKAKDSYDFPMIYDQILNYEACLMEGRRNQEDWMMFVDTDEYFWAKDLEVGSIPRMLESLRHEHELATNNEIEVASISMNRINFFGAENGGEYILRSSVDRCEGHLIDVISYGNHEHHQTKPKIAARPQEMLGAKVEVHFVKGIAENRSFEVASNVARFNHYKTKSVKQLQGSPDEACQDLKDPKKGSSVTIKDESLFWAADYLHTCTTLGACEKYTMGQCGNLCPRGPSKPSDH